MDTKKDTTEVKENNVPEASLNEEKNSDSVNLFMVVGIFIVLGCGFVGIRYIKHNQK